MADCAICPSSTGARQTAWRPRAEVPLQRASRQRASSKRGRSTPPVRVRAGERRGQARAAKVGAAASRPGTIPGIARAIGQKAAPNHGRRDAAPGRVPIFPKPGTAACLARPSGPRRCHCDVCPFPPPLNSLRNACVVCTSLFCPGHDTDPLRMLQLCVTLLAPVPSPGTVPLRVATQINAAVRPDTAMRERARGRGRGRARGRGTGRGRGS